MLLFSMQDVLICKKDQLGFPENFSKHALRLHGACPQRNESACCCTVFFSFIGITQPVHLLRHRSTPCSVTSRYFVIQQLVLLLIHQNCPIHPRGHSYKLPPSHRRLLLQLQQALFVFIETMLCASDIYFSSALHDYDNEK